jgi:hypothetical protein
MTEAERGEKSSSRLGESKFILRITWIGLGRLHFYTRTSPSPSWFRNTTAAHARHTAGLLFINRAQPKRKNCATGTERCSGQLILQPRSLSPARGS